MHDLVIGLFINRYEFGVSVDMQSTHLKHLQIVNAYDPTIAPIMKGKSNCPAQ